MTYKMFSVYDKTSELYGQPFFSNTNGSGIRAFGDECKRAGSAFFAHREDYDLFVVGLFDDSSGLLTAVVPAERIARGSDFLG